MQQSNLPHSSLPHIDLILLLSPKGLPLPPPTPSITSEAERLCAPDTQGSFGGLQRRYIITQWITGHRGPLGGGARVGVGGAQNGGATCRRVTWFHCPQLIIAGLPVGHLIHSRTRGDSGPPPLHQPPVGYYSPCSSMRGLSGLHKPLLPLPHARQTVTPTGLKCILGVSKGCA